MCEGKALGDNIRTERLSEDNLRRGPGGHWYCYRAWKPEIPLSGYGQTALEAANDLRSRL